MSIVKDLRERAGLSQAQLAEKSGVSRRTIESYEQGRRAEKYMSLEIARKIGDALRVSAATITSTIVG